MSIDAVDASYDAFLELGREVTRMCREPEHSVSPTNLKPPLELLGYATKDSAYGDRLADRLKKRRPVLAAGTVGSIRSVGSGHSHGGASECCSCGVREGAASRLVQSHNDSPSLCSAAASGHPFVSTLPSGRAPRARAVQDACGAGESGAGSEQSAQGRALITTAATIASFRKVRATVDYECGGHSVASSV
jgi:hypothetical protein